MSGIFGVSQKEIVQRLFSTARIIIIIKYIEPGEIILISKQGIAQKREIYSVNSVLLRYFYLWLSMFSRRRYLSFVV